MNDPEVNLNILKIPRVNSRSLRGYNEVNSGLIQNAPIELISYMNNPFVILGRYGPFMTDSSRLQQHHTTSDDPGQGCKAHEGGIRP